MPPGDAVAVAIIDRIEGGVAVVEVSLPPFTVSETVEIPRKYFGGREGNIYVHNGRGWARSKKMEAAALADAKQNAPRDMTGGGDIIISPPHTPPRPPSPSKTSFPGNFLHDAATMATNAAVAVKWNMTQQRVIDLVAQLRAQGFKAEDYR